MMEIIGFIALLVLGGYISFAGLGGAYGIAAFSGKVSYGAIVVGIIGLCILFAAFYYSPFTVSINTP